MDNVTHALAGLLVAESVVELRTARDGRAPSVAFARAAAIAGGVAAELPDADLLYAGAASGARRLGYLLHHRGHTHTVVAALAGALLVWGLARRAVRTAPERRALLLVCVVGTLSHLALDWTNNYGVHPFWPVDDRWYYGDAVFIVEPWLWVASIPALLVAARSAAARALLGFLLATILAAAWGVGMVSRGAAIALTAGAVAWVALAFVTRSSRRVALAAAAWVAVELTFLGAARAARGRVQAAAGATAATIADVVLTPAVADPLCYSALVVEHDATTYRVLSAAVAPAPALRPVDACPVRTGGGLSPTARRGTAAVRWEGEWSAPVGELAAMAAGSCEIAAALRFVRVPAWVRLPGAVELWDVRYGRGSFASIEAMDGATVCPTHVPPWRPPRREMLGASD